MARARVMVRARVRVRVRFRVRVRARVRVRVRGAWLGLGLANLDRTQVLEPRSLGLREGGRSARGLRGAGSPSRGRAVHIGGAERWH